MSVPRQQPRLPNAAQEVVALRRRIDRLEAAAPFRVGTVTADLGGGQVTVDVSAAQNGSETVTANAAPSGVTVAVSDSVVVLPLPRVVGGASWIAMTMAAEVTTPPPAGATGPYGTGTYGVAVYAPRIVVGAQLGTADLHVLARPPRKTQLGTADLHTLVRPPRETQLGTVDLHTLVRPPRETEVGTVDLHVLVRNP